MVNLYVSIYPERDPDRLRELSFCIRKNIENRHIDRIFILKEPGEVSYNLIEDMKLQIIDIPERPSYNGVFNQVNGITGEADINIIANTDIFFDDSIRVLKTVMERRSCFALTRWEYRADLPSHFNLHRFDSQDTWIFKGRIVNVRGDFLPGRIGCDSRIAYEIRKAGYNISNPSFSIKSYHVHDSNVRHYDPYDMVPEPHAGVRISNLNNLFANIWFLVSGSDRFFPYRISITANKYYFRYLFRQSIKKIKTRIRSGRIFLSYKNARN